jgi:hypothetical protein
MAPPFRVQTRAAEAPAQEKQDERPAPDLELSQWRAIDRAHCLWRDSGLTPKSLKISAHFDSPFAVFAVALIAQAIAA